MVKICHLSDIHWRGIQRHKEYTNAFTELFEQLKKISPDIIVNTGDVFHTKTQGITPEIIERLSWMFRSLANIAPIYTILGNHDGNLTNLTRQDIISPIHDAISHPRAHLLRKSGLYKVEEINEVRNNLREKGIEFKVIKNTLFKIAAKNAKIDVDLGQIKDHPVAAAFGFHDEVDPAKITYEYSRKNENLELIGGILNGKAVSLDQIKTLALMPSREEMYAKIVGSLASPLRGLANVLQGNLRGLVNVLDAYSKTRQ